MIPYYEKNCFETAIRKSKLKQLDKAVTALRKKYTSMIYSTITQMPGGAKLMANYTKQQIEKWFNSQEETNEQILEVLTPKNSNEIIFIIQLRNIDNLETDFGKRHHGKSIGYLSTFAFSSKGDAGKVVSKFHLDFGNALKDAFKLKNRPKLSTISLINKQFETFKKKKNSTDPIPEALIPILEMLRDTDFRSIVSRAKQAKDPSLKNIIVSAGLPEVNAKRLLQKAVDQNILVRQYNVTCPLCDKPLARVPTKTAISQMAKDNVSCPECRCCFSADSYQDCFVVADHIAKILDGSKWLGLYVRHKLKPYIPTLRVLTEVLDGPNEMDLVANVDGNLLLAELKDSRFAIGHAYSFVGKCSQYNPDITLIIATQGVDSDVKEYIQNTGFHPQYIETLESLEITFEKIFSQINTLTMSRLIGEITWTSMIIQSILSTLGESLPIPEESMRISYGGRIRHPSLYYMWEP